MSQPETFNLPYTRREVRSRLQPGDDLDDLIAGGIHLAERRAEVFNRAPTQADLEFALSIVCVWPFKTPPAEEVANQLARLRTVAFRGAAQGEFGFLDRIVPTATLTTDKAGLARLQQTGLSAFLRT